MRAEIIADSEVHFFGGGGFLSMWTFTAMGGGGGCVPHASPVPSGLSMSADNVILASDAMSCVRFVLLRL